MQIGLDLCSLSGERATRGIGIYTLFYTRALLELVREGKGTNHQFYLFSFYPRAELEQLLGTLPANFHAIHIKAGKKRLQILLAHQFGLAGLAIKYKLNILHSPGYGVDPSQPGLPALPPFTRRITTVHDLIPLHYPDIFLKAQRKCLWYKLMLRRVVHSDYVVTNSEFTRQDVITSLKIDASKIKCIPFAANQFSRILPQKPVEAPISPFVLAVGGPLPHKNLDLLIKAFTAWQTNISNDENARLVITGAGINKSNLQELIPLHLQTRVYWFDNLPETQLAWLYQNAMFLVFPSFYEGFGLPVLEAMISGCPVMCSNSAALPEVGGNAAYYFNPMVEVEIRQGLSRMWNDDELRQNLREAGYLQAKQFNWLFTAAQTLQIYQQF